MQLSGGFLSRSTKVAAPRGRRAYVVGDVHGRLDLLEELLNLIEDDAGSRRVSRTTIVFLGDLIDRGPNSAGVVERLRTYKPSFASTVFLMGNHEEVFLRVLEGDEQVLTQWLRFGGAECLQSYGLNPVSVRNMRPGDAVMAVRRAVPSMHVEFIRSFADTASFGGYLFVHAGIRPGVDLIDQVNSDLRWIRDPFLSDERDHGCVVVHGHTITSEVQVRRNRIGIDTGAYTTGVLTALALEGTKTWFLKTEGAMPNLSDVPTSPIH